MTGAEVDMVHATFLGELSMWEGIILLATLTALVSIVNKAIDAWTTSRRARLDLEKEYLQQMVADIEEIKRRLGPGAR